MTNPIKDYSAFIADARMVYDFLRTQEWVSQSEIVKATGRRGERISLVMASWRQFNLLEVAFGGAIRIIRFRLTPAKFHLPPFLGDKLKDLKDDLREQGLLKNEFPTDPFEAWELALRSGVYSL